METKPYPGWKNALEEILARFNKEGYGIIFTLDQLLDWMNIICPEFGSKKEFVKNQLEIMSSIDCIKAELIENHNLYFNNVRGCGYQLLHPNDQVKVGAEKHARKARAEIRKQMRALTNIDIQLLNDETSKIRLRKIEHVAFLMGALNKKQLPITT